MNIPSTCLETLNGIKFIQARTKSNVITQNTDDISDCESDHPPLPVTNESKIGDEYGLARKPTSSNNDDNSTSSNDTDKPVRKRRKTIDQASIDNVKKGNSDCKFIF